MSKVSRCPLAGTAAFWLVAAVVLLYRLGDFPLKDFDEAGYAEVAREMLRTGDYLTLHFNHAEFFEKPPLYFWASQLVIRALGFSEFSMLRIFLRVKHRPESPLFDCQRPEAQKPGRSMRQIWS